MCSFIYLFISGCAGSVLLQQPLSSGSEQVSYHGGLSCCGAPARGHVGLSNVAPRLSSTCSDAEHELSCSAARGIFPDQGSNLGLLHWQVDSLSLSHLGSPNRDISKKRIHSSGTHKCECTWRQICKTQEAKTDKIKGRNRLFQLQLEILIPLFQQLKELDQKANKQKTVKTQKI